MSTTVNHNKYAAEFVERMDRILVFVAMAKSEHVESFPLSVKDAYAHAQGSFLFSSLGTEMFEGNEPEGDTPSEQALVDRSIVLMERVREDLDFIISRLEDYTPEAVDAAVVELAEMMAR